MLLRNETQTHRAGGATRHGPDEPDEAKRAIENVAQVLGLPDASPTAVIGTVQKLEKVVKAVPRMEHFIHNVSLTMGEEDGRPLPLDKVIPLLNHWKAIVKHA